ncbi:MAG: hypothetical protein GEU98_04200 [Pseudonocardiaceae bacterium]|nr:hypothetical protein [Pseudonocardiaceae bacterium]
MELTGRVLFVQHQDDCPPGYVGERLEQRGARVEVVRAQDARLPDPREFELIVPLGSDDSAYDESVPYLRREWELLDGAVTAGVPVFGICFGAQLLSRVLGGQVYRAPDGPEIGWLTVHTTDPEFVEPGPWLVWHLDVMGTPPGGVEIASTAVGTQAFVHGQHVGTQFHPEATPASAEVWARHYHDALGEVGVDHDGLLAETRALRDDARRRAHTLTDRVLARRAGR